MRRIVIANQKGGSGKTTTAVNLAATIAEQGRRVLVIDLDPQRSASRWLGFGDKGGGDPNIIDVLAGNAKISDIITDTPVDRLDLIPSARKMVQLEKELGHLPVPALALKMRMDELPDDRWDYIIIDTPPDLRLITMSSLLACDEVLLAVQLSNQDIEGMSEFTETIGLVVKMGNPKLKLIGVLPCRVNMRTKDAKEVLKQLVDYFNGLVFDTMIRDTVKLRECDAYRLPITAYDPAGVGAADYRALARKIIEMEEKQ